MNRKCAWVAALGCLLVNQIRPDGWAAIPLEDFFRNSAFEEMKLSPDGTKLAVIRSSKGRQNLAVIDLVGMTPRGGTGLTDADVFDFHWKGDRLVFQAARDGFNTGGLYSLKDFGSKVDILVPTLDDQTRGIVTTARLVFEVIHTLPEQPEHVLVEMLVLDQYGGGRQPRNGSVHRMNVRTGDSSLIEANPGNIVHWVADRKGDVRAAVRMQGRLAALLWREGPAGPWQTLAQFDVTSDSIWPIKFAEDNRNLLVAAAPDDDSDGLYVFNVDQKKATTRLWDHERYELDRIYWGRLNGETVAVEFISDRREQVFFVPDLKRISEAIDQALPQTANLIVDWSDDRKKVLFLCEADRSAGVFYLFDRDSGRLDELGGRSAGLKWAEMAPMKAIEFEARDGRTIPGYLTLPPGRGGTNLPFVVLPHGGPWARDYLKFSDEGQFLASRGYAVLQVNFRGSTGYGGEFMAAGFKEWGGTIQHDITDGVRWVIAEGIADAGRIAIMGWSFGGYSAMWGLINEPELYRCGINLAGPTDLPALLRRRSSNLPL
ncbi:MAG TPA: hypothetical protein DCY13_14760, partial [Verrucomicrobiales bacterium]|nr:hypothetical protein [Verrucomicrobiales bacterium]